jgi:integrase
MASAFITTRTRSGNKRFVVRFRLGGRAYPIEHGGSFGTMKEARVRRDLIAGELAGGRNPRDVLRALTETPKTRTFAEWATAWKGSRVDVADETLRMYGKALARLLPTFADCDPATITPSDVQEWIGANADLSPNTVSKYLGVLRVILDFAGLEQANSARDPRVRLPRIEVAVVEPPSAEDVAAILANVRPHWRLPIRVLEQTGMRVGELHALEWRDVDMSGSRFRIREGKTRSARRSVAVPEAIMDAITETTPPDDRTPERRVFGGLGPSSLRVSMRRACQAAGIAFYSPHDLRHRYASVKIAEGVPVTDLAAQLGHSRKSLTLDCTRTS